jgi:hypothetical protein
LTPATNVIDIYQLAPSPALGIIAGKLAADICFYVPAIVSYELLRRRARPAMEKLLP